MNKNRIKYLFFVFVTLVLSCNKLPEDTPDENYQQLFSNVPIPKPEYSLITMPRQQCDPTVTENDYVYPGKELSQKRTYKVTLRFWFEEKRVQNESITQVQSDIELRFVDENKRLHLLTTLNEKDFKSGTQFEKIFEVESGFPLYFGIHGAGFELFKMRASIQATSSDGLIQTPLLEYNIDLYSDGYSDNLNYCEKIILP